ncbi:hypothetical protein Ciccas_003409 [Cichlidogyrus casuarinus]|uniref:Nuclear pore complex protein NUP96 C-terminal domain-containing protein n=1 Tax=Cichlidogyrus casuarinus TaxID=1844966 RepID=A0ABD2QEI0_9PLAT
MAPDRLHEKLFAAGDVNRKASMLFRDSNDEEDESDEITAFASDSDDESSSECVKHTPFVVQPLPSLNEFEGEPVKRKSFQVSDLWACKIPSQLKQAILGQGNLFNYALTSLDVKNTDYLESQSRQKLSKMFADCSLARGNGLRPSWGVVRHRCSEDDSVPSLHSRVRLEKSSQEIGFKLDAIVDKSPISPVDEALLNCAMFTSTVLMDLDETPKEFGPNDEVAARWKPIPRNSTWPVLSAYTSLLDQKIPPSEEPEVRFRKTRLRSIVTLCEALWADFSKPTNTDQSKSDMVPMNSRETGIAGGEVWNENAILREVARKQAVSLWIRKESFPWLKQKLNNLGMWKLLSSGANEANSAVRQGINTPFQRVPTSRTSEAHYEAIFCCLCAGQIELAARLALTVSLPALASLISQASAGDPVIRKILKAQLHFWIETDTVSRISKWLLKVYSLLAGLISLPLGVNSSLNILAHLGWVQTFGVFLWYLMDWEQPLADCLSAYSQAWHESPKERNQITPPLPPTQSELIEFQQPKYAQDFLNSCDALKSKSWPRDICYHLLQLHCRPAHKLTRVLDPMGFSLSEEGAISVPPMNSQALLDWAPIWHLWRILTSLNCCSLEPHLVSRIHWELASQLEATGLWEWSLFVQAHEQSPLQRSCTMKSTLSRHAVLTNPHPVAREAAVNLAQDKNSPIYACFEPVPLLTSAEQFITTQVKVPLRWIHETKALLTRSILASLDTCSHWPQSQMKLDEIAIRSQRVNIHSNWKTKQILHKLSALEVTHWFHAGHYSAAHMSCLQNILPQLVLQTPINSISEAGLGLPISSQIPKAGQLFSADMTVRLNQLGKLGRLLTLVLDPFAQLPITSMPKSFRHGAGIYLAFGAILRMTCSLTRIASRRNEFDAMQEEESQQKEREALETLRLELGKMCDRLQTMLLPDLFASVVKTEIALISFRLLTTFVIDTLTSYEEHAPVAVGHETMFLTLDALHQMLNLIIEVGLPEDFKCRESRALSALQLSLEQFGTVVKC